MGYLDLLLNSILTFHFLIALSEQLSLNSKYLNLNICYNCLNKICRKTAFQKFPPGSPSIRS